MFKFFRLLFILLLVASCLQQVTYQYEQIAEDKIQKKQIYIKPLVRAEYLKPKKVVTRAQYNLCMNECIYNAPGGWG